MLRRVSVLMLLVMVLCAASIAGAQETDPVQVTTALTALNAYLPQPIIINQLDSYRLTPGQFPTTGLGCPQVPGTVLAAPVNGYIVELVYQGSIYDIRVSEDNTLVVPCSLVFFTTPIVPIVTETPVITTTVCPPDFSGYLPPKLTVGGYARIGSEGQPNRMRAAPSTTGQQIGLINPGTTVQVLDGPFCETGSFIVWWQVQDRDLVGYTAEGVPPDYFLEPVDVGGLPALPGVRNRITTTNAATLTPLAIVPFEGGASVDFGPAGELLVSGTSGITVYDLNQLLITSIPLNPNTVVLKVEYSPDGRYIAYSTDQYELYVYDTMADQTMLMDTEMAADDADLIINDLDFSVDNLLAVAIGDPLGAEDAINGWYLFNLATPELSLFYPTPSWVGDVAFGPGGIRLAWLTDTVNMIVLEEQLPVITNEVERTTRSGLAFQPVLDPTDPDSPRRLAYADGSTVRILDFETAMLTNFGNEDDYTPGTIAFTSDGSLMVVMNRAITDEPTPRTLKLWDVDLGTAQYVESFDTARGVAISPDDTLIVVLTDDNLWFYGVAPTIEAVG